MFNSQLNLAFHTGFFDEDWCSSFDLDGFDRVDVPVFWFYDPSLDAPDVWDNFKELVGEQYGS